MEVPYGFCHCGCGGKTKLAKKNSKRSGNVRGEPIRFIYKHHLYHARVDLSDAAPFKIDGVYCRLIPLTQGQYTIVNASDYTWLMQWKWCASWCKTNNSFYALRNDRTDGKHTTIKMHRAILGLEFFDGINGDHRNAHNTLDNRRDNLRPASDGENAHNRRPNRKSSSKFKGVTWDTGIGKWVSSIRNNGTKMYLGVFDDPQEAHQAYKVAAVKYFGEFARFE